MPVNGNWSRGHRSVTIDTRGINAGTAEGQAALKAAQNIFRQSEALGRSASPANAQAFNSRAQSIANQVNAVSSAHRAQTAARAQSDAFVRSYVASQARRR